MMMFTEDDATTPRSGTHGKSKRTLEIGGKKPNGRTIALSPTELKIRNATTKANPKIKLGHHRESRPVLNLHVALRANYSYTVSFRCIMHKENRLEAEAPNLSISRFVQQMDVRFCGEQEPQAERQ